MKFYVAHSAWFTTSGGLPAYKLLVGRARRFTSLATQLHMEVLGALPADPLAPSVFATCHGEIQTAETLINDFRANNLVSGARFALSVHNSPSGVYSVATGGNAPTTTITGTNAVAAGWLEAALIALDSQRDTLLSIADEPVSPLFCGPTETLGVAYGFTLSTISGRSVELAETTAKANDTVATFAHLAHAFENDRADTIVLGTIREDMQLELRVSAR
jgi:hypothetical protein